MAAIRIVLMALMCLVTEAPAPTMPLVFEHLEDGEEVRVSRRRVGGQHARLAQTAPVGHAATVLVPASAPRPRPAVRPAVRTHTRKAPPPLDTSSSLPTSEDH